MSLRHQAGINLPGYNALKVANAPTIGTATSASGTSVSVAFTAPSCVGGGAITSYTAFACCGVKTGTAASSPITVAGLTTGQSYTFKVFATNAYGPSYPSAASNSVVPLVVGQQAYTTAGTYTWVAPAGVTSVSVVAVGGGRGGNRKISCCGYQGISGAGGSLSYKNNITVTSGGSYTVVVGAGGSGGSSGNTTGQNGGNSYFLNTCTVNAKGGGGSGTNVGTASYVGGAGNNCSGIQAGAGGGGAAGYAGNGGLGGGGTAGYAASGGGGAGGDSGALNSNLGGQGGGGVGLLGQGCSGTSNGTGGSGGATGSLGGGLGFGGAGGTYGGGGGSSKVNQCNGGVGAVGAVRIIWPGTTRSFPSTCTGNL